MKRSCGFIALGMGGLSALPCHAEEAAGGLPQLDVSAFPAQLFWLAICFGLLYVLMAFVALPRVAKTQDNRKQVIAAEIAAARAANDAAKATAAEADKALAKARSTAQDSVSEMMAQITTETAARQGDQDRELQRRLHSAEEKIAVARQAALNAIGAGAADLAKTITDKMLNVKGRAGA